MSYSHLTIKQRHQLETLINQGLSQRAIAKQLGVHPSTICRELKRFGKSDYDSDNAQVQYLARKQNCGRRIKLTPDLHQCLLFGIFMGWSPERMSVRNLPVSFKTIYTWLHKGLLMATEKQLVRKGKRPKTKETRGKIKDRVSISERSADINSRKAFGHWELDTVVSPRGKDKTCVATLVERKTRFYIAIKIPDRTAQSFNEVLRNLINQYQPGVFKSLTCDNGKEFSGFKAIADEFKIPVYFADPYASWQRGSNENSNGLLRRYFPKGTCFRDVTQAQIDRALININDLPRKVLNGLSNKQAFYDQVLHLI